MTEEKVGTLSEKPSCCFLLRLEWCQRGFHPYPSGFCSRELIYGNLQVRQNICALLNIGQSAQHWLWLMHYAINLSLERRPQNKSKVKTRYGANQRYMCWIRILYWIHNKGIRNPSEKFYLTLRKMQSNECMINTVYIVYALHVAAQCCGLAWSTHLFFTRTEPI